jgi:hypothetical protein
MLICMLRPRLLAVTVSRSCSATYTQLRSFDPTGRLRRSGSVRVFARATHLVCELLLRAGAEVVARSSCLHSTGSMRERAASYEMSISNPPSGSSEARHEPTACARRERALSVAQRSLSCTQQARKRYTCQPACARPPPRFSVLPEACRAGGEQQSVATAQKPREDVLAHPADTATILLTPWVCFRGGGFPSSVRRARRSAR